MIVAGVAKRASVFLLGLLGSVNSRVVYRGVRRCFLAQGRQDRQRMQTSRYHMNTDRTFLSDALWARNEDMLPGAGRSISTARRRRTRGFLGHSLTTRTGSSWRDFPERFGNWNSDFKRFRLWALFGVFGRVFNVLHGGLVALRAIDKSCNSCRIEVSVRIRLDLARGGCEKKKELCLRIT